MSNSIFDWIQLIAENVWVYGGSFFLVLGILVFVHEWGHYIVARMNGIKIDSFSIGFGPELFGINDKNGTRWKFSLIPLGGYVKMFGDLDPASAKNAGNTTEEDSDALRPLTDDEKKVAFYSQSIPVRAAVVFAGPAINFLFAMIILAGIYSYYGQPVTPPMASAVIEGSAADKAGFMPHDTVVAIDDLKIRSFEDIRQAVMVGLDEARVFTLIRNGEEIKLNAIPEKQILEDRFGFKHSQGLLGIIGPGNGINIDSVVAVNGVEVASHVEARELMHETMGKDAELTINKGEITDTIRVHLLAEMNPNILISEGDDSTNVLFVGNTDRPEMIKYNLLEGLNASAQETLNITLNTLYALKQMVVGTRSATELGGIIRIGAIAGDMAQSGFLALLSFTALLSINLGLINLFPIPMLDGGHLVFYGVEAVKGSPLSERMQEYAFRVGIVVLIGIMLFANINDIVQLIY